MRRRSAQLLPWLGVGLLLFLLYRSVSVADVVAVLRRLTGTQLAWLVLANAIIILSFSTRWWIILRAQGFRLSYLKTTGYRLAAYGLSYFTPGPHFGGEPMQVLLVERNHAVPRPLAVAAMALDKSLELVVNFLFLVAGVLVILEVGLLDGNSRIVAVTVSLLLLVLPAAFIGAIWAGKRPISAFAAKGERLLLVQARPSWLAAYRRVVDGLRRSESAATTFCRDSAEAFILAFVASVASWVLMLAEYWLMVAFLGVELDLVQLLVTYTAARIAFLLPLPGGLGTVDAAQVFTFTALGLDPAVGLSASLLIHARNALAGAAGLWWGSRQLRRTTA